jgi:hypothetical protein
MLSPQADDGIEEPNRKSASEMSSHRLPWHHLERAAGLGAASGWQSASRRYSEAAITAILPMNAGRWPAYLGKVGQEQERSRDGAIMGRGQWVYVRQRGQPKLPEGEKAAITAACEKFIAELLKPRFLPRIEPTSFNYPVDIYGKWHGSKYRFIQRFRSDHPDALTPEFDAPFARLEYVGRDRFDLFYYRHTGEWFCLYRSVPFAEALRFIESDGHLHPI